MEPISALVPCQLRCEYHTSPLGIETPHPRLDWRLHWTGSDPAPRGLRQSAWQVLVASDPQRLVRDEGDLWDSGKVTDAASIQISYAGQPLVSSQACHWKVRIWDGADRPSPWSAPAQWTMGLLEPGDWQAAWIAAEPRAAVPLNFDGATWVWHAADLQAAGIHGVTAAGKPAPLLPPCERTFRHWIDVPAGRTIVRARVLLAADDQFKLYFNGLRLASSNWQGQACHEPQLVSLTTLIEPGRNLLAVWVENEGTTPAGLMARVAVEFAEGEPLLVTLAEGWCSAAEPPQDDASMPWFLPQFDDRAWAPVAALAEYGAKPWGRYAHLPRIGPRDVECLRREFTLEPQAHGGIARALLHVSALGTCECEINGQRVGDEFFTPGWTEYKHRVLYRSFDVGGLLREGANAIGAQLAAGWFAGYVGWSPPGHWGTQTALRAQLEVVYGDGTREVLGTDAQWHAHAGPIVDADFQMGEHYDARLELPGWSEPGFVAPAQSPARPVGLDVSGVPPVLQAHPGAPVRVTGRVAARAISEPAPGIHIFDMGQNMVGVARLRLRATQAGQRVTLRHGEMLNPDGTLYTTNLRRARAIDVYRCAGAAEERYTPRFTFHGFRYVEVRGLTAPPELTDIEGLVLGSDTPQTHEFSSSSPMLNQLASNISWGQRGNYLEVPTDCPQRDERLGWTGDAQVFVRTASYLVDIGAFFTKWLVDLEDSRNAEGAYPDIAPALPGPGFGSPAWGDAGIICPYHLWRAYDDRRALERHWPAMTRYIEWMRKTSDKLIRPAYGYGDWLCIAEDTSKSLIGTAYFAYDCALMAEMATALGRDEEARQFARLREQVAAAFQAKFVGEDGRIEGNTQTAYVLGLHMDLLTPEQRARAIQYLAEDIAARGGLLSVGFVGISYLCPVLAANGRLDVAYQLLLNERYPSWGYEVRNGATTIWERWNSYNTETGFGDVRMNSFNHYAFGSIGEWMFDTVCGIAAEKPGYGEIRLRPRPGGGLTHARLKYDSIRGPIRSGWRLEKGRVRYEFEVPPNTTARLSLATADPAGVTESGRPLGVATGIRGLTAGEGEVTMILESGSYAFSAAPAEELVTAGS